MKWWRRIVVRLPGLVFACITIWCHHVNLQFTWKYGDFEIAVPYWPLTAWAAVMLALFPLSILDLATVLFGEQRVRPIIGRVDRILGPLVPAGAEPDDLARAIVLHIRKAKLVIALSVTLLSLIVFFSITVSRHKLLYELQRSYLQVGYTTFVQHSRIDFSNKDAFSRLNAYIEPAVLKAFEAGASTHPLVTALAKLLGPGVKDRKAYLTAAADLYDDVKAHLLRGSQVAVDLTQLAPLQHDARDRETQCAYLTVLGIASQINGIEQHLVPYMIAAQLLGKAREVGSGTGADLPATVNALGISYAQFFRRFSEYESQYSKLLKERGTVSPYLPQPGGRITMGRLAVELFQQSRGGTSSSHLDLGRSMNNEVDARIQILNWLYGGQKRPTNEEIGGGESSDSAFLYEAFGWPTGSCSTLQDVFKQLGDDLRSAMRLANQPELVFTRAQLSSVQAVVLGTIPGCITSLEFESLFNRVKRDIDSVKEADHLPAEIFDPGCLRQLHVDYERLEQLGKSIKLAEEENERLRNEQTRSKSAKPGRPSRFKPNADRNNVSGQGARAVGVGL